MPKKSEAPAVTTDRSAFDAVLDDLNAEAATLTTIKAALDASTSVESCALAAPASHALSHLLPRLQAAIEALDRAIVGQVRA